MDEGPSNAEIVRRLDVLSRDWKDDFAELRGRLDSFVLREVYQAERTALQAQVTALETRAQQETAERRNLSRWIVGVVVIPITGVIVQIILNLQGPT